MSGTVLFGMAGFIVGLSERQGRGTSKTYPQSQWSQLSATSVGAAGLAVAAARCLLRLRNSPRFRLLRMTHWVTTRFLPRNLNHRTAPLERSHCSFRQGFARAPRSRSHDSRAPRAAGLIRVAFDFVKCPNGAPLPSLPYQIVAVRAFSP